MTKPRASARRDGADTILAVAEGLIGQHGVEGVSMRQIAEAAGLSNPFSVQYHYGGKAGLIQAIVDSRQPWLEARRGALFVAAQQEGRMRDMRTLLDAILRPLAEIRDQDGQRSYARLLWQIRRPEYLRETPFVDPPTSTEILRRLQEASPHLAPALFARRFDNVLFFFLNAVVAFDLAGPNDERSAERSLYDCLDMAAAAMAAAVSEFVREGEPVAADRAPADQTSIPSQPVAPQGLRSEPGTVRKETP